MTKTFDEAYANYLSSLAKLDTTEDIFEKNVLFKQLTEQLSDLEYRINNQGLTTLLEDPVGEDSDLNYWI